MAKQLEDILKGVKSSKNIPNTLGKDPGVDYKPKAPDEQDWAAKTSPIEKHADSGNGDDIYQATNVKYVLKSSEEKRHGRKRPEDKKVYEEVNENDELERLLGIHARAHKTITNTPKNTPLGAMHPVVYAELDAREKLGKMGVKVDRPKHPQVIESMKADKKAGAAVCNESSEGTFCEAHGMSKCSPMKKINEKEVSEEKYIGLTNLKRKIGPMMNENTIPVFNSHDSNEAVDMVKTELRAMANKAMHLVMAMPAGMHVEPWVQSKIAQAKEMVSSIHDYMIYGDNSKPEEDEQGMNVGNMNTGSDV